MTDLPVYLAETRACLDEIRTQQRALREFAGDGFDVRLDEINRITTAIFQLHSEWKDILERFHDNHSPRLPPAAAGEQQAVTNKTPAHAASSNGDSTIHCQNCHRAYLLRSQHVADVHWHDALSCPACGHLMLGYAGSRLYWLERSTP